MRTQAPFHSQLYCDRHNRLAGHLKRAGIAFQQLDNTFSSIASLSQAQTLSDACPIDLLQRALDAFATRSCPVAAQSATTCRRSIVQVEYATDIVSPNPFSVVQKGLGI